MSSANVSLSVNKLRKGGRKNGKQSHEMKKLLSKRDSQKN